MINLGEKRPGATIYVPFYTFDSNDPQASVTITGLAVTDIEVYKDGSMTQRASDSGYTLLDTDGIDLDGTTGIHGFSIDLSDNTTAGFWASGSQYMVVIASITVDAATVNFIPVIFTIGYPDAIINTTIATLSSQTSFTLTSGPAEDDALNGCPVIIHDVASAVQLGHAVISDYVGSTKTVTLAAGTTFTAAATDNIAIYPPSNTQWITSTAQTANDNGADINTLLTRIAQTLNLTASGNIGIDWANVENQGTSVDLSATATNLVDTCTTNTDMRGTDSALLASSAPTNFGDLAITVTTGQVTVGTNGDKTGYSLTATTGLGNQTANITGNLSGSVGSVTGSVGSVTGNINTAAGTIQTLDALDTAQDTQHSTTQSNIAALNDISAADVNAQCDTALSDIGLHYLVNTALPTNWSTDITANSALDYIADDGTAVYDRTTDSLQAIRDRGDAAWTTGGGGSITDILNIYPLIPNDIDLANTSTWRLGLMLINSLDDLPTTAEITPGTIDIDRKAIGGTSWTSVVSGAACSELAGMVYYDEVFDTGTGYAEGDSIRVTFYSQKITVAANDYEVSDANGRTFYTSVRQTMRGTDSAATASALATAQADLDTLTGADGVIIASGTQTFNMTGSITGNLSGSVGSVTGAVGSVTGNVGGNVAGSVGSVTGNINTAAGTIQTLDALDTAQDTQHSTTQSDIATLNNLSAAQVNAEVVDALATDTYAEPGQGAPAATTSIVAKINYLYKAWRNKSTQTATTYSLYDDAGTTVDQKATVSDDGTTATKAEVETGP